MTQQQNNNEIDLLELLAKIYFVFKRNKFIIIGFTALGLIYGIYSSTKGEPYYSTEMISRLNLSNDLIINKLKTLEKLNKNRNYLVLSEQLNLPNDQIRKIKSIAIEEIEETSLINVKLKIHDKELINDVKNGILNFLENNDYIQKELKLEQEHNEQFLERITEALEVLKEKENQKINHKMSEGVFLSDESYSDQLIKLMDKRESVEKRLMLNEPLTILNDFYVPDQTQRDTTTKILLFAGIGLFLGLLVVVVLFLIRKLEHYSKK
mgnify:CR=1 FL=1